MPAKLMYIKEPQIKGGIHHDREKERHYDV